MDDFGDVFRALFARAFGGIMAITHARDEQDARDIGERHAYWILNGSEMPTYDIRAEEMAERCTNAARAKIKRGGK